MILIESWSLCFVPALRVYPALGIAFESQIWLTKSIDFFLTLVFVSVVLSIINLIMLGNDSITGS